MFNDEPAKSPSERLIELQKRLASHRHELEARLTPTNAPLTEAQALAHFIFEQLHGDVGRISQVVHELGRLTARAAK